MKPKQHLEFVRVDLNTGWERPPGAKHGPFTSKSGCILHAMHYYETSGKDAGKGGAHAQERK